MHIIARKRKKNRTWRRNLEEWHLEAIVLLKSVLEA